MSKVCGRWPFSSWSSSTRGVSCSVWRLRRGGRVLRDLGIRHHRCPAAGTGLNGADLDPLVLRAALPSDHPGGDVGDHRHRGIWPTGSSGLPEASRPPPTVGGRRSSWPTSISSPPVRTTWPPRPPPSPLQNFWSLAVEEQFYVVYPTLFLLVAGRGCSPLRARLAIGLVVVIVGSFVYSVVDTHSNPVDAFFSPFTRAWELALGALVAVCTPWLLKVPGPRGRLGHLGRPRGHPRRRLRVQLPDRLPRIAGRHSRGRSRA